MKPHLKQLLIIAALGFAAYAAYAIVSKFLSLLDGVKNEAHSLGDALAAAIAAPFTSLGNAADAVLALGIGPDAPNPEIAVMQNNLDALNHPAPDGNGIIWNFQPLGGTGKTVTPNFTW